MNQNLTFEHDPYSRKASRYFLWLYGAALVLVLGSIALQFHSVAFGVLFLTLAISGFLLRRLHERYQALEVVEQKIQLQQEANRLQEKLGVVQKSLTETKERREHLLHKEQFGLEATLRNQQIHHIDKGLSSCLVKDAALPGHVVDTDIARVRTHRFARDREPQSQAGSIASTPLAKLLKQITFARRNPPALVLRLDEQSAVFGARPQNYVAS